MAAVRQSRLIAVSGGSTTWSVGINLPSGVGQRGHMVVVATNAIVAVRSTVVVDTEEFVEYHGLAGPGLPVFVPVDRFGVTLEVRPVRLTTFTHAADGTPTASTATEGSILVAHRPDLGAPLAFRPRLVASESRILGQAITQATNTQATVQIPLGPPGLYRIHRVVAYREVPGAGPTSVNFASLGLATGRTANNGYLELNAAARATSSLLQIPTIQTPYGDQPRDDYFADGWGRVDLVLSTAAAADELFVVRVAGELLGLVETPTVTVS